MPARYLAPLASLLLLAACGSPTGDRDEAEAGELATPTLASAITPEQFARMANQKADFELIDVRTPEEFAEGHIADASNIDWKSDDFAQKVSQLPKDKDYVLYCHSGRRSAAAQEAMAKMGFHSVASMTGGITAWQDGEMPVVK